MTPCIRAPLRAGTTAHTEVRPPFGDPDKFIKHLASHPNSCKSVVIGPAVKIHSIVNIRNYLRRTTNLAHLTLNQPNLLGQYAKAIAVALCDNRSIVSLSLSRNRYNEQQLNQFFPALKDRSTKLDTLMLDGNQMGIEAARYLGDYLSTAYKLKRLTVAMNTFGDEGIAEIAKGLSGPAELEYLNLKGCRIGSAGAEILLAALKRIPSEALIVNLEKNFIGAPAERALSEWAATSVNKRHVMLSGNCWEI